MQALSTAGSADNKQSLSVLDIQAIGRVVKEIISSELSPTFKEDFQSVKHSIEFMSNEFDSFKNELLKHKEDVNKLNKEVMTLKQENEKLKSEVAEMQGYTRKDSVVVTGIPETKNESVFEVFNKLSSVIKSPVVSNGLSTAHRLPSRGKEQIKPIVFKFVRRQDKEGWLADFKQAASEDNGGAGISTKTLCRSLAEGRVCAYQHLAPTTMELFRETKKLATQKGYRFVWIRDGKILVRKEEGEKPIQVKNVMDLKKI